MAQKETYHLPGVRLEIDFSGEETHGIDSDDFRPGLKRMLMQHLIKDGVVFEEADSARNWKANGQADTRLESVIDSWIRNGKYESTKAKDKHAKKVRWILNCDEQVTILLQPD